MSKSAIVLQINFRLYVSPAELAEAFAHLAEPIADLCKHTALSDINAKLFGAVDEFSAIMRGSV